MRRIIERVVTVVTTTTWKISWEADPPPAQAVTDPASDPFSALANLPELTPTGPTVIEIKEADLSEEENTPDQV